MNPSTPPFLIQFFTQEKRRDDVDADSHGLGLFVLNLGPACGTILNHNGSVQGYATLMYSTPD